MKKFASVVLITLIIVAIAIKTVGSFTLCGGTLLQNFLGISACSNNQKQFIGFGHFRMEDQDLFGAFLLVLFLFVVGFAWKKWGKNRV